VSRRNNTYFDVMSLVRASLEGDWRLHPQARSMHNLRTSQRQRLERQLDVVALRGAGMTLQEVGDRCGVTRERARQLLEDFAHLIKVDKASRQGAEKAELVERARLVFQSTPGISRDDLVREVGASWTQIRQSIPKRWLKFISFDDFDSRFQWSKDQILESLRRGAQIESPLSRKTFDILVKEGVIDCCTTVRIGQIFGKWSTACELAGVESVASWISEYERNWTEEDCLDWLCRFLVTQDPRRSIDAYAQWIVSQPGNPPSSGTIRGMIGPWSDSINEALPKLRSGRYADLYRVSLEADCSVILRKDLGRQGIVATSRIELPGAGLHIRTRCQ